MNEFKNAKEEYESMPIPEELHDRVRAGIRQGQKNYRASRRSRMLRRSAAGVAACFAVVFGTLNLSPTVAEAAADVPVLGGLFQVLTVRSYETEKDQAHYQVEVPEVASDANIAQRVNAEIQAIVDEKIAEGEQMVADYKDAFFATGGTQEQWDQRDNTVSVTYEIKSQTDTAVSFVVDSVVTTAVALEDQFYYNLDLAAGKELTLADVLGEDWVTVCNDSIRSQMAAAEDPSVYFDESMGGFTTVDETTQFYLNEAGSPVVVFPKYTVAIGAMGVVEFEISK